MPAPERTAGPDPWSTLLDVLVCPLCGGRLATSGGSLRCPAGHTFDIARQGYVSLLSGGSRAAGADTAAMVRARAEFLDSGHFAPLARLLAERTAAFCPAGGTVLEAGVGTGHHLAAVLDALPRAVGLGLDSSKFALRLAARAHPRLGAASWDLWQPLPVRSGSVDVLLNVFAPRNGEEFHRVLRPSGALLVVTPTARHLDELRQPVGLLSVDATKEARLHRTLSQHFRRTGTEVEEAVVGLDEPAEVENLVAMGPTARHLAAEELHRRVAGLDLPVRVTLSFRLSVYRPLVRSEQ
ncbi:putative RNA methyltransferase [Streptomyces sp. TP-A0874]|uniref:putative RNA methyltransferase n=1 Tax=Streptomyces sp. TP-A0874 TaxID=549819 RepID=UPI000852C5A9|nr:methyltransferase type 11 [Streptomyces sp. TP-A0874]